MADDRESYGLNALFERQVGLLCTVSAKFVGTIGHALDPDLLRDETVRLVVKVVRQIYKETGRGPSNPSIVLQRLQRLNEEGKVAKKQIDRVLDLMIETDMVDEWDVVHELKHVVKRQVRSEIVQSTYEEYAKHGDFSSIREKINYADSIGEVDNSVGLRLGESSFAEMDRLRRLHRMPLGIPELDAALRGGPPRGTLTMFLGAPGGGKSMMLSHSGAVNWGYGMFVVYATLELPEAEVSARVKANQTGVPIEDIISGKYKQVKSALRRLRPTLGTFIVQYFSPKTTSASDIIRWIKRCEELEGYPVDLFIVDYVDKLKGPKNSRENEYITQGVQAEELRVFAEETGKWGLTASQVKIKGRDKRARITMDDVRDSTRKIDVADLVIPITKEEEDLVYGVDKFRYGAAGQVIGPIPHDWSRGRMAVMDDAL